MVLIPDGRKPVTSLGGITHHRPDIDGLRAIAVAPVVLFHAGAPFLSGGFVGVDIFFVISGYLISNIILRELEAGTFNLTRFYERRARRILPAFFFVAAATTVGAVALLLPSDLTDFGNSLWAAALSASNIYFWQGSGDYFAEHSETKALLHTWSLGVEEQFYVFFPLLLCALKYFAPRLLPAAVVIIFIVSFIISLFATNLFNVAAFYLLPSRAWELLAGTLLALAIFPKHAGRLGVELIGAVGVIAVAASVILYDHSTSFPGLAATLPVLGAAAIIWSGSGETRTLVYRVLSWRPLRWVGLISFSLYLWHWPLIVFARYYFVESRPLVMAIVVCASFLLAALTWRFVEQPFRKAASLNGSRAALSWAGFGIVCTVFLGAALAASRGLPSRVSDEVLRVANKSSYHGPRRDCGLAFEKRRTVDTLCSLGATDARPSFAIIGDSHGDAMAAAVFEAGAAAGRSGYQVTATGYRPLLGYEKHGEREKYSYLNALVTQLLDREPEITDVVLVFFWRQGVDQDRYFAPSGKIVSGSVAMRDGLAALITRYPEKRFLIVTPTANSFLFGGGPAARSLMHGRIFSASVTRLEFEKSRSSYCGIVAELATRSNVQDLDLSRKTCDEFRCHGTLNGELLYSDDNHISYFASRLYLDDFESFFKQSPLTGFPGPRE